MTGDARPGTRDPLLPNAGIVARREYRDRVKSPLFVASTFLLMALALGVALAPVAIRYLDRQTVTRIAVVADDARLASMMIAVTDSILNVPPGGTDPATWAKPFRLEVVQSQDDANAALIARELGGVMVVTRLPSGQLDITFRTNGPPDGVRSQLVGFAAVAAGILDWTSTLPEGVELGQFKTPAYHVDSTSVPTNGGKPINQQEVASRGFLGVVFVVLLFLSVIIYGMWVATGVASEKSSRVMELMISAASPRQLLTGKVVGIGGAGLTQYVAIAVPALFVVAVQDRIAEALMGPAGAAGAPIVGLTPGLLLGYGVFFLLGFTLFALIYAAMGSFVSRPDDLQILSLPLSLVAIAGYLMAVVALTGGVGTWTVIVSFVPPFSPFVMLARLMISEVQPIEVVLSVAILVASVAIVAVVAARMYEAGVLLYGQRPGFRAFVAAARRAS
jgi:ABC-2 type transport system permease protein